MVNEIVESYWRVHCPIPETVQETPLRTLALAGCLTADGRRYFEYGDYGYVAREDRRGVGGRIGHYAVFPSLNADQEDEHGCCRATMDYYGIVGYGLLANRGRPVPKLTAAQELVSDRFQEDLTERLRSPHACLFPVRTERDHPTFLWHRFQLLQPDADDEGAPYEGCLLAGLLTISGEWVPYRQRTQTLTFRLASDEREPIEVHVPVDFPCVWSRGATHWTLGSDFTHSDPNEYHHHPLGALLAAETHLTQSIASIVRRALRTRAPKRS